MTKAGGGAAQVFTIGDSGREGFGTLVSFYIVGVCGGGPVLTLRIEPEDDGERGSVPFGLGEGQWAGGCAVRAARMGAWLNVKVLSLPCQLPKKTRSILCD